MADTTHVSQERSRTWRQFAKAATVALAVAGFAAAAFSGALASDDGWDDGVFASGASGGSGGVVTPIFPSGGVFASGGSGGSGGIDFDDAVVFPSGGVFPTGGFDDSGSNSGPGGGGNSGPGGGGDVFDD